MAKNGFFKTLKNKLAIILALVCVFSFSMFCLVACGDEEASSDPTYTYNQDDDATIKNANFSLDTSALALTSFPKTSVTGWTRSTHNSAPSSLVNSGTIKVTELGWEQLLENLCDDDDFISYLDVKSGKDLKGNAIDAIKAEKEDNEYKPTDKEIVEYVAKNYVSDYITNPSTPQGAKDSYVYMLNNYLDETLYGSGTAQRVTSSSTISLEKNSYAKISVWVKTQNIQAQNANSDFGANIVLNSKFNSTTQAEYRISNIIANDWTEYVIYVKADDKYTCELTLSLGLGYGKGASNNTLYYTEGTAYFDGITYETVENIDGVTIDGTKAMVFGSEKELEIKSGKTFLYDMSFDTPVSYFTALNFSNLEEYYYLTKSNVNNGTFTSETIVNEANLKNPQNTLTTSATKTIDKNSITLNLKNSSYTLKLDNNGTNFKVDAGKYTYISFDILNNLSIFGSTSITVDVYEVYNGKDIKRPAVATFSTSNDEVVNGALLFKNNFEEGSREFYITFVIGPTSVATVNNIQQDLASGTVAITNLCLKDNVATPEENDNAYTLYNFYTNLANSQIALYSGYDQDVSEDTEETDSPYSFTTAPGNVGNIYFHPTDAKGYYGVTPDHAYMTSGDGTNELNTRSTIDGENGSYAGVINSKLVKANNSFPLRDKIMSALADEENDLQALMIYNENSDSYGYIGDTNSVSTSARAKITVKVKPVGDAVAYVYLVDSTASKKDVMTFSDFTINNNISKENPKGTEILGSSLKFEIKVTKDMCDKDGWATVNFFIATGATQKDFRLEIWNGSRDGQSKSQGMVLVKEVSIITVEAFYEPERYEDAFSVTGNPLFDAYNKNSQGFTKLIPYTRELTKLEEEFNAEYTDKKVSYSPMYVWAQTSDMIYAIFNTVDPLETNPYDSVEEEIEDTSSGCSNSAETDPATFWLSFSSIFLGVVLVLSILALIIKTYRRKHANDTKQIQSHYNIKSRTSYKKDTKVIDIPTEVDVEEEDDADEVVEEEQEEATLDEYVYGEVQDFGNEKTEETNEEKNDSEN